MIRFNCAKCKARLSAHDDKVGSKFPCPKCGQRLQVPTPPPAPVSTDQTMLGDLDLGINKTVLAELEPAQSVPASPVQQPTYLPTVQPVQPPPSGYPQQAANAAGNPWADLEGASNSPSAPIPSPYPPAVGKYCVTCGAGIHGHSVVCPHCGCAQPAMHEQYPPYQSVSSPTNSKRIAAGILAIFIGPLGIHKFILGYPGAGIIMLLVTIFGSVAFFLGPLIMSIIALIEGIIYLCMSDQEFNRVHGRHQRPWF